MKIWTKMEWTIMVAACFLLLLLFILFGYSYPHSDDFSYNYFLQNKGYWEGLKYLFNNNTGRFCSTAIIFLSPLKMQSVAGYQWLTASLFGFFVISFFLLFRILLHRFVASKNIVILFAFVLLCFCTFVPDMHEFCYWLCGEATYLMAAALWIWAVILHTLLAQTKYQNSIPVKFFLLLITIAITGCSEVGVFLYCLVLFISWKYRRQNVALSNKFFYSISLLFFAIVIFVFSGHGNVNRQSLTPFSGNILLALSGGFYAAGFWLSKWAMVFVPVICFYMLLFGHRLLGWSAHISKFAFFKAKTVFISSILFFLFCQILVVWMSGSTPEHRFENILFLFLLVSFLFAAQLMMNEQTEFFNMLKGGNLHRGFKTLSFVYLLSIFMVVPNNFFFAMLDILSGNAQSFAQENKSRAIVLTENKDPISSVKPINAKPQLLYYPLFSCAENADSTDIPRLALADYFGKKWIYEYPCSSEIQDYSIKEILKQKRQKFFAK